MLQPLQLKEVSVRYAGEIAELRDFLAKAGVPVGTSEALGLIAERVRHDRGFHRDLISYVWVVIDSTGRQIGYSDLLGVLAIAAAGERFAAAAEEDAAHEVLRFLMEARHELDDAPAAREQSAGRRFLGPEAVSAAEPVLSLEPLQSAGDDEQDIAHRHVVTERATTEDAEMPEESGKRSRVVWILVIVLCVLAALLVGFWMYQRSEMGNSHTNAPVITVPNEGTAPAPVNGETSAVQSGEVFTRRGEVTQSPAVRRSTRAPSQTVARAAMQGKYTVQESVPSTAGRGHVVPSQPAAAAVHGPASTQTTASVSAAPVVRSAAPSGAAVPLRLAPRTSSNAGPVAVPADTLSKRLGARTMPADLAPYGIEESGRKHPELKRRQGYDANGNVVAEVRSSDIPARPGSNSAASAGTARGGVVRAGSEGIMAENLLYGPAPVYPAAASAAHVEGEVRVQASIDRDGNVAAARIISGPPLLRDAALDAVHRWRFRPRMSHGKPAPSSATAVLDFDLP